MRFTVADIGVCLKHFFYFSLRAPLSDFLQLRLLRIVFATTPPPNSPTAKPTTTACFPPLTAAQRSATTQPPPTLSRVDGSTTTMAGKLQTAKVTAAAATRARVHQAPAVVTRAAPPHSPAIAFATIRCTCLGTQSAPRQSTTLSKWRHLSVLYPRLRPVTAPPRA